MNQRQIAVPASALTASGCRAIELPQPFRPGFRFGHRARYEVSGVLGAGATAVVVLVEDSVRRRLLAAKLLRTCDGERPAEALFRARAEARTLRKIRHENIVNVYGVGRCNDTPYVLLEHRDGIALDQLLAKGPLPLASALDIGIRVASALEHAHTAGVLHLDVKPANVWLTRDCSVKLLDFGMDAELARARRERSGGARLLFGTPAYMAPEQWRLLPGRARHRPPARARQRPREPLSERRRFRSCSRERGPRRDEPELRSEAFHSRNCRAARCRRSLTSVVAFARKGSANPCGVMGVP
jgi:serine/threonine protein kinase